MGSREASNTPIIPDGQLRAYRELLQAVYEHRDDVPESVKQAALRCVVDMEPLAPEELRRLRLLVGLEAA